jgi:hypothetical protein
VYRQFNVVRIVEDPATAAKYLKAFEFLFAGNNPAKTKQFITKWDPMDPKASLFVGFSPRVGGTDLKDFVDELNAVVLNETKKERVPDTA